MSKLSRTILTAGVLTALALSAPLLAGASHDHQGDREARHGHHGHMMMAKRDGGEHRYGRRGHERHGDLNREERKAHRAEMRVQHQAMRLHWDTLSDSEKAGYKEQARMRMEERRAAWQAMSPEERDALREQRREHRGEGGYRR